MSIRFICRSRAARRRFAFAARNHLIESLEYRRMLALVGTPGDLYVSGQHASLIYEVNPTSGAIVGSASANNSTALGIRFDSTGNLDVVNDMAGSVGPYNGVTGAFIDNLGSGINDGYGLAVANNQFYVADSLQNQRIAVFNVTGGLVTSIDDTDFTNLPVGVTVSPANRLLVGTRNGTQIDSFNLDGSSPSVFASGNGIGPTFGLAYGPNGNLYVSNANTNTILQFNGSSGAFISNVSGGGLNSPLGIAFSPVGNLYVANNGNDTISKFNSSGGALAVFTGFGGVDDLTFNSAVQTSSLVFTSQPTNTTAGGAIDSPSGVQVSVEGTGGSVVTGNSDSITLSLASSSGGATLGGTLTEPAVNGVATFNNLSITKAGSGYSLIATDSTNNAITAGASAAFNISSAPAATIVYLNQPTNTAAGAVIDSPAGVQVETTDAYGNLASTGDSITLSLGANPTSATLGGTLTSLAVNGIANFSSLAINKTGMGYTLTAADTTNSAVAAGSSAAFNISAAAVASLVYVNQPGNTIAGAVIDSPAAVQVETVDSYGNLVPADDSITLSLGNNPGSTTLTGTVTSTAINGIANFSNLSITKAASGFTLLATDTGNNAVTAGTSTAFNISAGAASTLLFLIQPTNTIAGAVINSPAGVELETTDSYGNLVFASDSITLALGNNPAAATLGGTVTSATTNGIANFSNLSISKASSGYTLIATDTTNSAVNSTTSAAFNISAGSSAKLVYLNQPGNTSTGAVIDSPTGVQVEIVDSFSNLIASSDTIAISLLANPGSAILSGKLTSNASGGVATFNSLSISNIANGYTLSAADVSNSNVSAAVSTPFDISGGPVAKLVFLNQPTNTTAGAAIGLPTGVEVELTDANNNLVSGTDSITLSLGSNPGSTTLNGTVTVAAVNGIANFSNLSITKTATGYTLLAADPTTTGVSTAGSASFNIIAGIPARLSYLNQPVNSTAGSTIDTPTGVQVEITDAYGNLTAATDAISVSLSVNPGSTTLGGTLTANASGGVASFANLSITAAAKGYVLQAVDSGNSAVTSTTSSAFNISSSAATKLVFASQPGNAYAGAVINSPTGLFIDLEDAYGNLTTSSDTITIGFGSNPGGGALGGTLTVSALAGVANFAGLTVNSPGNGFNLVATDRTTGTVAAATSALFNVSTSVVFTNLQFFTSAASDPDGNLVRDTSGNLYGVNRFGGQTGEGTIFELSGANYSVYTTLYSLTGTAGPDAGLTIDSAGNLYGITRAGGTASDGSIFELAANHTTFTTLVSFNGTNGQYPVAGLTLDSSGNLYGTTLDGGGYGNIFELSANHTTLTSLIAFTNTSGSYLGAFPQASLTIDSSGNLYGTTSQGGTSDYGTVFELSASHAFSSLFSFTGSVGSYFGSYPVGPVTLDSTGNLFGTTEENLTSADGTLFELAANHATFTNLVAFTGKTGSYLGAVENSMLTFDSYGNLYGTTSSGGINNSGSVFELSPSHSTFITLVSFTGSGGTNFGADPLSGVIFDNNGNAYGTTAIGGGYGTVYEISSAASATKLAFTNQPTNTAPGAYIDSPTGVQVTIENSSGQPVNSGDTITLSLHSNGSGATLTGTLTAVAVNGVATFSNLIASGGSNSSSVAIYTLVATDTTANSVASATSSPIASLSYSSYNIGTGSTVTLVSGFSGPIIFGPSGLIIAGTTNAWTGRVDITNDHLDFVGGSLATIINQVAQGYSGGTWAGEGITSSTAAGSSSHLTAVGVVQNNQSGSAIYGPNNLFDGTNPGTSDVLAKYTYYGDANLDGKVDGSDYSLVDNGSLNHLTGWYNGDFNYDGIVNGSDYTLIDNAFNRQGASVAAALATPATQMQTVRKANHLKAVRVFSQTAATIAPWPEIQTTRMTTIAGVIFNSENPEARGKFSRSPILQGVIT